MLFLVIYFFVVSEMFTPQFIPENAIFQYFHIEIINFMFCFGYYFRLDLCLKSEFYRCIFRELTLIL